MIARVARALWPSKTDMHLACRTGRGDRACRNWLAGRFGMSADDLAALLRGEEGFEFLEAAMGGARREWWGRFKRNAMRAELRSRIDAHGRAIEQLELKL